MAHAVADTLRIQIRTLKDSLKDVADFLRSVIRSLGGKNPHVVN